MYRLLIVFFGFVIAAGALRAEPFAENFDVMGILSITVDGHEMTMYVPYDRSRDRPFVTSRKKPNGKTVSITAASPTETGAPGRPMAQLFVTFGNDATPKTIYVRLSDDQGVSRPMLSNPTLGASAVTEYQELDDGKVRLGFKATLVRVDVSQSMSDPLVIEGITNAEVSGVVEYSFEPTGS